MTVDFHNVLAIVVSIAFLVISLVLVAIAIRSALTHNAQIERRLAAGGVDIGGSIRPKKNLLQQLGTHLTLPNGEDMSRMRFELAQAGYFHPDSVKIYHALRVVTLFGPQLVLPFFWGYLTAQFNISFLITLTVGIIVICLFAPQFYINWRRARRTDKCREGFPDMMDLMIACIEAGLGMDAALIRVTHEIGGRYPALRVNLELMNLELRAGRDRNTAMMSFANRINLEEARALAVMLKQADEMGSSLGRTLRTFADEMRMKRMMRAEEKAMALSAKLTVPLIVFIFPTILVMVLMPACIRIMESF